MLTVEYAFTSTHDTQDEYWESESVDTLDEAAEIIERVNPQDWEVIDELGDDRSQDIVRRMRQRKKDRNHA